MQNRVMSLENVLSIMKRGIQCKRVIQCQNMLLKVKNVEKIVYQLLKLLSNTKTR